MARLRSVLPVWWRANRTLGASLAALGIVVSLIVTGAVLMTGDGGTVRLGQAATTSPPSATLADEPTVTPTRPASPQPTVTPSASADRSVGDDAPAGRGGADPAPGSAEESAEPLRQHVEFDVTAKTTGSGDYPETVISVRVHGVIGGNMWALFMDPQADGPWAPTLSPEEELPKCVNDGTLVAYDRTFTFRHHYRSAGEHRLTLESYLGVCRDDGGPRWNGSIDVSKGSNRSNGPEQPRLQVEWQDFDGANRILAYGSDVDGSIAKATIRWDNGTTVTRTTDGCIHGDMEDRRGWLDGEMYFEFPIEAAASSAEVTVTSTGCDGKDAQTVSTTVDESDRPEY